MTTVLMMFLFPIGLYTYFVIEKKTKKEYQAVFDDFQNKTASNAKLSVEEKINLFEQMLLKNGYEVTTTNSTVIGEKKVLSMGLIFIGLGVYIVGLFVYLAYYFLLQKPHVVEYRV